MNDVTRRGLERWSSRKGFVLATIGSAVGLGSIWKFPYEVGENGGGTFLLFYILGLLLVVFPLLIAEFVIVVCVRVCAGEPNHVLKHVDRVVARRVELWSI